MPKLNLDNPVFRIMNRLGDLFLLNLLWAVCCLPIITIGASTTALFYVARKMAASEKYLLWQDFLHSFRLNLRQSTAVWLLLAAAAALFAANLWGAFHTPGAFGSVLRGISAALCLLWFPAAGNAFALLARYEYSTRRVIADALLMGITHPTTGGGAVALALWLPLLFRLDPAAALYLLLPWLLVCGALSALLLSSLQLPVFRKLEERRETV